MSRKDQFVQLIEANNALINKVVFLYADELEERRDLYQEIVSNAWSSFARFKGDSKFSTWLYRVALNVAITSLKKKKRLPFDPLAEAPELEVKSTDDGELRQQIMRQLNPIEKSIVLLLIDGMEQHEIAEIVGISAGNVRVKIHRIREKLRKYGIQGFVE